MALGEQIAFNRKLKSMTQEMLANRLSVSNQAVSKWESNQCCPDIQLLPQLADIFEISMDELFDRKHGYDSKRKREENEKVSYLPFDDDNTLRVVLFQGHTICEYPEVDKIQNMYFEYQGVALNIESHISVKCGNVQGNINAGTDVSCRDVEGSINAGMNVVCADVGGNVSAGMNVTCVDVEGNVSARQNVSCESIEGDVTAKEVICNGEVEGKISIE